MHGQADYARARDDVGLRRGGAAAVTAASSAAADGYDAHEKQGAKAGGDPAVSPDRISPLFDQYLKTRFRPCNMLIRKDLRRVDGL